MKKFAQPFATSKWWEVRQPLVALRWWEDSLNTLKLQDGGKIFSIFQKFEMIED